MGSNVPILPVFVGASHAEDIKGRLGLAGRIHALRISDERSDIQSLFHEQMFEDVLDNRGLADEDPGGPLPRFECAFSSQERTSTLFSHLNRARGLPGKARGRYCGALTSFALPSTRIGDPIWSRIDGPPRQGRPPRREDAILKKLRDERRHLQAHSSTHGCDLIVEPSVALKRLGPEAAGARAEVLRAFLRDVTRDPTRDQMRVVVMSQTESRDRNPESTCYGSLMIFGDWFVAESRTPLDGPGYRQTTFTSHAPTVLSGIRECDLDFDEIYAEHEPYFQRSEYQGSSVRAAIDLLTAFIAKCAELVRLAQAD